MPADSASSDRTIYCPQCTKPLLVNGADPGRRKRCPLCHHVFELAPPQESQASPPPQRQASPPQPKTVSFSCSLCDTRITAKASDEGRQIACPDCGRKQRIPAPAPPPKPKIPAAMSGGQYELWGVGEGPTPTEQLAGAPTLHPVFCLRCDTLMYARDEQVGTKLKCPDCGSHTLAKARAPEKRVQTAPNAGDDYELSDEPLPARPSARATHALESTSIGQIPAVTAAMAARKQEVVTPPAPRPVRPKQPLLQGVWPMLLTQEIIARWILIAICFGFAGQAASEALTGKATGLVEIFNIFMTIFGVVMATCGLSMTGPLCVAIVGESADGNDALHDPPQLLAFDWFGELFLCAMAAAIAGLAGAGAGKLAELASLPPLAQGVVIAAAAVIVFPPAMLSAMLEGHPFGVVSPRLLASMGRNMGPWLLFYLETFALAGIVGVATWLLAPTSPAAGWHRLVWGVTPCALAALLIDMRLLGRLGWQLEELTDVLEPEKSEV